MAVFLYLVWMNHRMQVSWLSGWTWTSLKMHWSHHWRTHSCLISMCHHHEMWRSHQCNCAAFHGVMWLVCMKKNLWFSVLLCLLLRPEPVSAPLWLKTDSLELNLLSLPFAVDRLNMMTSWTHQSMKQWAQKVFNVSPCVRCSHKRCHNAIRIVDFEWSPCILE